MVMETSPSPQCVGREFVRQYYTLLNEAPAHLHRFYNNSSSFIHGGLDPPNRDTTPVVGQKQIHQRIQQLNFRDCHAKISQVDSQATLGNGVVVQVTGELSNGGQPMRRFTQTFVLAAQSPKKYYVHNDIFRYQDMMTDEELEAEMARSEAEEDHEIEQVQPKNEIHKPEPTPANVAYYGGVNPVVNGTAEPTPREEVVIPPPAPAPVPVHEPALPQPLPPINSLEIIQQPPVIPQSQEPPQPVTPAYVNPEEISTPSQELPEQPQFQPSPAELSSGPGDTTQQPSIMNYEFAVESVNEPKTYATLVKSGGGQMSGGSTVYYNNTSIPPVQSQPKPSLSPPPGGMKNDSRTMDHKLGPGGPKPQRINEPMQRNSFPPPRPQSNDDNGNYGGGADGDRRRPTTQYSDSHQLFMGNLPHTATESELKELFGKFGTIVDLRILSKPGGKGPGPMRVPNYGFIVFEDTASVQAVLNAKPILFPDGSGNGTKLNVEEKKARRGGGGGEGGRVGGPRGGPMRGGMGGPPRAGRGGGGMRFPPNNNRR